MSDLTSLLGSPEFGRSWLPFTAAILLAIQMVLDKMVLAGKRLNIRELLPIEFLFLAIAAFVGVLLRVHDQFLWPTSLLPWLLLAASVSLALVWNTAYYKAMQSSSLGELELSVLAVPLLTPLLAFVVYPNDAPGWRVLFALIAAATVIWAHLGPRRRRIHWLPIHALVLVGWSAELLLWPAILHFFPPAMFYLLRTSTLCLIFLALAKPRIDEIERHQAWPYLAASGSLGGAALVILLSAIQSIGLVASIAAIAVVPLIVFVAERTILHERLTTRLLFATGVVMIAAVLAQL